jgi:hypothetical protein
LRCGRVVHQGKLRDGRICATQNALYLLHAATFSLLLRYGTVLALSLYERFAATKK